MEDRNYKCPRCGYSTCKKTNMHRHLFVSKKECPGILSPMIITDDIKKDILKNRKYHPPIGPPTAKTIINNYNHINMFISKMDPIEKITKYIQYKSTDIIDIDDHIEQTYHNHIQKLESNSLKNFYLDHHNIFKVIDTVTTCHDIKTMNILHDTISNKLKIYVNGQWESVLFEHGVVDIMQKIQSCYLDYYEAYLLKKGHTGSLYERQCVKENLREFLVCFEMMPLVKNEFIEAVIADDSIDVSTLQDTYQQVFADVQDKLLFSEANRMRKQIYEVIRANNKTNMLDLNKQVMDLMHIDECFKEAVLARLRESLNEINT